MWFDSTSCVDSTVCAAVQLIPRPVLNGVSERLARGKHLAILIHRDGCQVRRSVEFDTTFKCSTIQKLQYTRGDKPGADYMWNRAPPWGNHLILVIHVHVLLYNNCLLYNITNVSRRDVAFKTIMWIQLYVGLLGAVYSNCIKCRNQPAFSL